MAGLNAPDANFSSSASLKYDQAVYIVSFARFSPRANGAYGYAKGKYAMNNKVAIRASDAFRLGETAL